MFRSNPRPVTSNQNRHPFQVHTLNTRGRFRQPLDCFWDLQAHTEQIGFSVRMIGLTATLRPADVEDVMRRMSVREAVVFRQSCFRPNLDFTVERVKGQSDIVAVERAAVVAMAAAADKVLVFCSTVRLCDDVYAKIRASYKG